MSQANDQRDDIQTDIAAAFTDFDLGIFTMIEDANSKTDLERFVKKYR